MKKKNIYLKVKFAVVLLFGLSLLFLLLGIKRGPKAEKISGPIQSPLVSQHFPQEGNQLHDDIVNLMAKQNIYWDRISKSKISQYHDVYLLHLSVRMGHAIAPYFYNPKWNTIERAEDHTALHNYPNRSDTSMENIFNLLRHVCVLSGYECILLTQPTDIPHKTYKKRERLLGIEAFSDRLTKRGISIQYPSIINDKNQAVHNYFVYMPLGGRIYRYEITIRDNRIARIKKYLLGSGIGDYWLIN